MARWRTLNRRRRRRNRVRHPWMTSAEIGRLRKAMRNGTFEARVDALMLEMAVGRL